jgi:heme exporter protein D
MMPDLGRYAAEVLSAYAVSLVILALLVGAIWWRGARIRRQLGELESRRKGKDA